MTCRSEMRMKYKEGGLTGGAVALDTLFKVSFFFLCFLFFSFCFCIHPAPSFSVMPVVCIPVRVRGCLCIILLVEHAHTICLCALHDAGEVPGRNQEGVVHIRQHNEAVPHSRVLLVDTVTGPRFRQGGPARVRRMQRFQDHCQAARGQVWSK